MMSCSKATRLISEGQDRDLTATERARLSLHTMMCRSCRRFESQMNVLRTLARTFAGTDQGADGNDPEDADRP
ncbi:zf-HC2 domain-containing protein [Oleiagrimonas sp.]|jgi:predicted anti-sigma-YlaC factor YlaD|uniref:anti-sigma factor family protein n=1 Tax=Oleiagrimonas sp. TaxID=2010330 RepID=UPI00262E1C76|nr:zf-HC2 domain-containing protein [Oleiagrimonas sp.]MDA3914067.1 zf-HC2 domain-containing protein [Oleiagrimonas sp.]